MPADMDVDVDIVLDADQDNSVVVTTTQDSTAVYNADFTGAEAVSCASGHCDERARPGLPCKFVWRATLIQKKSP